MARLYHGERVQQNAVCRSIAGYGGEIYRIALQ